MNADDVTALNDQLAAMARAGLPLDQGLSSIARDLSRGKLRRVTEALAADLRSGMPIDVAIKNRGQSLPPYYSHLIQAGIRTGRLPEVLATMSLYSKTVSTTRAVILEAMLYPAVVLLCGLLIFGFLLGVLLPQFATIYNEFGMSLPWVTKFVLSLSNWGIENYAITFGGFFAAIFILWLFTRFTKEGRRFWAQFIYQIPIIGTLLRSARLAAFTELLGMLVQYEVPLPEAFRIAGLACADPVMAQRAAFIADELAQGTALQSALAHRGLVPEWMAWMSGAGERNQDLAGALKQVSLIYRRQVDARLGILRSVFPAFMTLMTASVITGLFALAVIMPMIKLLEGLSK